ncbi:hypothetical protein [Burkholderia sp. Ax-1719]|uniref:hypothetical protein n=1 Tax=Burkholderia sp. Ax-1719 TaxID=2608334 RepID=UPI0014220634|nr:hypothetical protein [Burkholderia sp. Ax-1719]NIE63225.1 hypothetical protein [Burkholderia sp. Ax-1719]
MQGTPFHSTDEAGQPLKLGKSDISGVFIDEIRQNAIDFGSDVALIANASHLLGHEVEHEESYLVIVLPETDSEQVPNRAEAIDAEVRRKADGYPIACVMFANKQIEVDLLTITYARPLLFGRLNVVWIFKDEVELDSHPYTQDMEEYFCIVASVAASHWHEHDPYEHTSMRTPIELHTGFLLDGIVLS